MFRTACYVYTYIIMCILCTYIYYRDIDLIQNNFDKTIGIGKRRINQ